MGLPDGGLWGALSCPRAPPPDGTEVALAVLCAWDPPAGEARRQT